MWAYTTEAFPTLTYAIYTDEVTKSNAYIPNRIIRFMIIRQFVQEAFLFHFHMIYSTVTAV